MKTYTMAALILLTLFCGMRVAGAEGGTWAELMDQTNALYQAQKLDEALASGTQAIALAEKEFGSSSKELAFSMTNVAYIQLLKGNPAEAENLCRKALAISEKILKADDPELAVALYNLADVYKAQKKYADAESLYKRALAIADKNADSEDAFSDAVIQSLSELYTASGRADEAQALLAQYGQK